ncbi:MAG TPA: DNA polymerase I [Tissierellia bacterium]|jgi:DNA polymerase-1|nr:DNA polymerase I [Tissierellia bacterium]
MKKLLLVDGNSLVNRAYYALPPLTNKDGVPTGAIHGFLTMLFSMLRENDFDHLMVAFDTKAKTFRHKEYPDYKATRKGMPDDLAQQMPILKEILDSLRIMHTEKDGYEADDLIGTLAMRAKEDGFSTVILTGDRDLLQLVQEDIEVSVPRRGVSDLINFDEQTVIEDMGIHPNQVVDYKGLRGDPSDNIPGVKGIGDVTAKRLLASGKHLEDIYNALPAEPKTRPERLLLEGKEEAFVSRELATIFTEVPLDFSALEQCALLHLSPVEAEPILEKYQLRQFLRDLRKHYPSASEESPATSEQREQKRLPAVSYVDTSEGPIYTFFDEKLEWMDDLGELVEKILPLERVAIYDAKALYLRALEEEVDIPVVLEDVMLLSYLVNPLINSLKPEEVFASVCEPNVDWKALMKGDKLAKERAARMAECASLLAPMLLEDLDEKNLTTLYRDLELPLVPILARIQYEGFQTNADVLEKIGEDVEKKIERLESSIHEAAGRTFNVSSPKQLGEVLFDELLLPVVKKTKTGYSTDKEVLDKLKGRHPIIDDILEYRIYTKLKGTYVDGLRREITNDGRIHSNLQQTIAVTGRLSSTEPNLQNIPVRLEEGRKIRQAFVASPGNVLVSADYDQIELRVLAHISDDEALKQAFAEGEDIHRQTASLVFGVPAEDVTRVQRGDAKAVNFGIVYGISDFGLSENISIPIEQAKVYKERYFAHYPKVKQYMEDIVEFCRTHGYVKTLLGRIRPIPDIKARNFNVRSFAERTAINTPVQGSAADIIKLAMLRVDEALRKKKLSSRLILQVHDELILDVPKQELEVVKELLREAMVGAIELSVPLEVSLDAGESWYDL